MVIDQKLFAISEGHAVDTAVGIREGDGLERSPVDTLVAGPGFQDAIALIIATTEGLEATIGVGKDGGLDSAMAILGSEEW